MPLVTPYDTSSGAPLGSNIAGPVTFVKPIAASSVLLRKAWVDNLVIEATFVFFLPDPANGDQSTLTYRVTLTNGRVSKLKSWQNITPSSTALLESVTIEFAQIVWEHPSTNTETNYSR